MAAGAGREGTTHGETGGGPSEEAAKRYLEAFKQMVTLSSAGPLIVIGLQKALLGTSQPSTTSLLILGSSLVAFVVSLLFALYGMMRITVLDVAGRSPDVSFFLWLSVCLGISVVVFLIGLTASFVLFFLSGPPS